MEWVPYFEVRNPTGEGDEPCPRADSAGADATTETCSTTSINHRWNLKNMMIRGWGGLCLHLPEGNVHGGSVVVRRCDPANPNQRWTWWYSSDPNGDQIRFGDGSSGHCLTMPASPTSAGVQAVVTACGSGWNTQEFSVTGRQQLKINEPGTNCLDVSGRNGRRLLERARSQPEHNSPVQRYGCLNDQYNQRWNFTGPITRESSGQCLRRRSNDSLYAGNCATSDGYGKSDWDYYPIVIQ